MRYNLLDNKELTRKKDHKGSQLYLPISPDTCNENVDPTVLYGDAAISDVDGQKFVKTGIRDHRSEIKP